jgi:WD40 repeat protein
MPSPSGHNGINALQVATLTGHTAPVIASAFGPYGVCLATAGLDHTVRIWRLDAAAPKQHSEFFDQRLDEIRAIVFTPGGDLLVSASGMGGRVWLWRWRDERDDGFRGLESSTCAAALAVSPDGKQIAAADNNRIQLWSVTGGQVKLRGPLPNLPNEITTLAFSANGQFLFGGDALGLVHIWRDNGRRFKLDQTFQAQNGRIFCLAVSPDDRMVASSGSDNVLRIWAIPAATEPVAKVSTDLRGVVRVIRFGPFSQVVLTASDTGQVARWTCATGQKEVEWRLRLTLGSSVALADHGNVAAAGLTDGTVILYQLPLTGGDPPQGPNPFGGGGGPPKGPNPIGRGDDFSAFFPSRLASTRALFKLS